MIHFGGSRWCRWDLHIHTPESILNMQFSFENSEDCKRYNNNIWDKYIDELEAKGEKENISVVGITDYCSVDGYEKIIDYRQRGRVQNFDLILANVEFRILPVTSKDKAINLHCIFSDELTVGEIKRFLNELNYDYQNRKYKCNKEELIELGRAYNPDITSDKECYKEGVNQFKVDVENLKEVINKDERYKEKVFIVISNNSQDGASGLRDSSTGSTRQELYRNADFIFSGNEGCRDYFLGRSSDSIENIIRKCGSLKACIHGSDAHDFEKLFNPDMDRFCWIKAEPTFNGLRQILFEPESRVKIQKEEPETQKNIYSIKRISIPSTNINQELSIRNVELQLNKNLVAIIGGKGSGKTAIIDVIANCYQEHDRSRHYDNKGKATKNNEDKNSFVQRIEKECPKLEVELDYIDKHSTFNKKITDNIFFQHGVIRYLPQGKIEEVAGNTELLHKIIQQLIFTNIQGKNNNEYTAYRSNEEKIADINNGIISILGGIRVLLKESSSEILLEHERQLEIKKGELKDKETKLSIFSGQLSEEEEKVATEATEKLKEFDMKYENTIDYAEKCFSTLEHIKEWDNMVNAEISELNQACFDSNLKQIPNIEFSNLIELINYNVSYASMRKEYFNEEKIKYSEVIKRFSGKQSERASLLKDRDNIKKAIHEIEEKISELHRKKREYISKVKELFAKYEELMFYYKSQKNSYDRIIELFKSIDTEILSSISFKAEVYFNENLFIELSEDVFDGRKIPDDFLEKTIKSIKDFLDDGDSFNYYQDKKTKEYLRRNKDLPDYYRWLTQDYFRLDTKVYFNGTELSKLSVGQKGAVILKLYLADGDYPIILDQPEDNLDNRFISNELITAFRKAKEKRQIIIATHNANLVVNADAEQIVVADFINNSIVYTSGSIENNHIRKEVASLLEGGEEAFKQRENKYGFQ
ncbi:hypothetical protein QIH01_29230 [Brevibacillus brevis]|nr:hypothetical protein QIH01_29230 [Brevibacillus brevis]